MVKQLVMGNEAIALGAIRAGVQVVTGYPGTPSTEVLETISKHNPGNIYVEWSVNEKVALEVAAGSAYAGARTLVTMKQVGLNVASDPLMSLNYIGVKGGMVVLVADDPGPISSQTEQDTRHFGRYSNIPVFDPSSVEEAYALIEEAFKVSEQFQTPVLFRPTTRICHGCATITLSDTQHQRAAEGFIKDNKWVIFPKLAYENHILLEEKQRAIGEYFSNLAVNALAGEGTKAIMFGGNSGLYGQEVLQHLSLSCKTMQVVTPYPFPEQRVLTFLEGVTEVLVLEELDPVLEDALWQLIGKHHLKVAVQGKINGFTPYAGEFSYELVADRIGQFLTGQGVAQQSVPCPVNLPVRPPVLCAGCPHRGAFYSVKQAMKGQRAVFSGDIGCYTLGNAQPLDMVDTCLCMGAGITVAQGLQRVEPEVKHFAFIGDSTFFHTGIAGVINSVYNNTDITIVILDNSTTAMTGHQPHPGTAKTMMGNVSEKVSITKMLEACGVSVIRKANPLKLTEAITAVQEASQHQGVSAVLFEAPCIAIAKPNTKQSINEQCIGCKKCIREIGCPAIFIGQDGQVMIDQGLCYGCGLCGQICPVSAIQGAL